MATIEAVRPILTPEMLLTHWQGHRQLTRRTIEAFPEEKLFGFSIGEMRPFSNMALECLKLAAPTVRGVATANWTESTVAAPTGKAGLLALWDEATNEINALWPTIPPERFRQIDKAFGKWESDGVGMIQYVLENEIHHRGQGYVYLRALGIEPPPFYIRG